MLSFYNKGDQNLASWDGTKEKGGGLALENAVPVPTTGDYFLLLGAGTLIL